jgi:hypothetical protein
MWKLFPYLDLSSVDTTRQQVLQLPLHSHCRPSAYVRTTQRRGRIRRCRSLTAETCDCECSRFLISVHVNISLDPAAKDPECGERSFNTVFPRLVCLADVPIALHRASTQVNNCHAVSTTGLCGKYSYSSTLAKCLPRHGDCVPTTRVLGHSPYRMIPSTHGSLVCLSITKESRESNKLMRKSDLTCVTSTDGRWEMDISPIFVQMHSSQYPQVTKVCHCSFTLALHGLRCTGSCTNKPCSCSFRRPFVYRADSVVRKSGCSWDEQMSAMTYNRFQYYSKLRTYALDDWALVSGLLLYIRDACADKPCTAQWSLYVPPGLTFKISTFCPHSVFTCFVWISEQTAIISLYSINWLVFITETQCVQIKRSSKQTCMHFKRAYPHCLPQQQLETFVRVLGTDCTRL